MEGVIFPLEPHNFKAIILKERHVDQAAKKESQLENCVQEKTRNVVTDPGPAWKIKERKSVGF